MKLLEVITSVVNDFTLSTFIKLAAISIETPFIKTTTG